jgi:DNA-binding NarL/FixJ family response regulator
MTDSGVRVLTDDHPLFREGMVGRLDRVGDITVVGEAQSGLLLGGFRPQTANF